MVEVVREHLVRKPLLYPLSYGAGLRFKRFTYLLATLIGPIDGSSLPFAPNTAQPVEGPLHRSHYTCLESSVSDAR